MTKRLIAMCIAVTTVLVLFSGCQLWKSKKEDSVLPSYNKDLPADELDGMDGMTPDELDLLAGRLQEGGYLPEGVTIPPEAPTMPQPLTLPAGDKIDNAEVAKLVKAVQEIIKTRTFYLKGTGNNPMGNNAYAPMVMAVDQDKLMVETETDWTAMMKEMAKEEGKVDLGQSRIQGAVMQTTFGKKLRMIFLHSGAYMVLPEKNLYTNLSTLAGEDISDVAGDLVKSFSNSSSAEVEGKMTASRVKVGDKEYLCATLPMEDGQYVKYFFLKEELKRMEFIADDGTSSVIEIDEFSGKVDPNLFKIEGMKEMNPSEMTGMFSGFDFG